MYVHMCVLCFPLTRALLHILRVGLAIACAMCNCGQVCNIKIYTESWDNFHVSEHFLIGFK